MNIDAIWSSDFFYNLGFGGKGILVFDSGRVSGGDSQYTYSGSYKFTGESILEVVLNVKLYAEQPISELAKYKEHTLILKGKANETNFGMLGYFDGLTEPAMKINLVRRAELVSL